MAGIAERRIDVSARSLGSEFTLTAWPATCYYPNCDRLSEFSIIQHSLEGSGPSRSSIKSYCYDHFEGYVAGRTSTIPAQRLPQALEAGAKIGRS